jgi:hypothetical protein
LNTIRNLAIVFGCLMIALIAAPQYTNPSDPYLGNNKLGICYNHAANNWINVANTSANYTNYALQCDAQGILNTPTGGTVTSIGITTANGVSGSSSGGAAPRLTVTLGAITPTSTNGVSAATMAFNDATSSIQTQLNTKLTASAPTVGQAACIKAAGPPVVIGFCSTVVGADGSCTCN